MDRQINKIKYNRKDGEIVIDYSILSESTSGGLDEIQAALKSYDEPKPEFIATLSTLTSDVEKICSLPIGYCVGADIRGVSFSYKHDVMGATITALVPVETANSPVVINTPFLPSDQYNEDGKAPVLPSETRLKLKLLIAHANEYVDGDRKPSNQLSMDL